MARVNFVRPDGTKHEVEATDGHSVMQVARAHLIPGIVAECGGELSCATCHVYVDDAWVAVLPVKTDDELDMLEVTAEEPTDCSRLSCQIKVGPALDGITVTIPRSQ